MFLNADGRLTESFVLSADRRLVLHVY